VKRAALAGAPLVLVLVEIDDLAKTTLVDARDPVVGSRSISILHRFVRDRL